MPGQPTVFDFAVVTSAESATIAPQIQPYSIVESGDTVSLKAYLHCGGDSITRGHINEAMSNAVTFPQLTYYFQDLQGGPAVAPIVQGGAIRTQLAQTTVDSLFRGAGPLVGSGLDPTDDYYDFDLQAILTGPFSPPAKLLVVPGATGTWRVLLSFVGRDLAGNAISAFDDSLIIRVIG